MSFDERIDDDNVSVCSYANEDLLNTSVDFDEKDFNKEEIEQLIDKFIKAIRVENRDADSRMILIEKLCRLRIRLNELNDENCTNIYKGHQLIKENDNVSNICLHCLKRARYFLLPPIVQSALNENMFKCVYCNLTVHNKCADDPSLIECPREYLNRLENENNLSINEMIIYDICPEKGLSYQEFKCEHCNQEINFSTSLRCDYNGLYYCRNCHVNQLSLIPARVFHNWDTQPRFVSIKSYLLINYLKIKPFLFNILDLNSMLYGLVEELYAIKKIRLDLCSMMKYIRQCKQPSKPKIALNAYIFDEEKINSYSLGDLVSLSELQEKLLSYRTILFNHITKSCESCKGKGFYCELCRDKVDLLFPFSPNNSTCQICAAVFHKNCYHRKGKTCPRCLRLNEKVNKKLDESDGNGQDDLSLDSL